jgi:transketolase
MTKTDKDTINKLETIANELRIDVIDMIYKAQSGHPGGSLSATEIVTALYFHIMRTDPKNPTWPARDRFILSKGHACPIWYAALSKKGFFERDELWKLRKIDGILQGHPDMLKTPGIDMTTGSLGNGLGAGVGMALSAKYRGKDYYTYVIIGCSEHNEGVLWEAALSASKFKLDNIVVFVDYNKLQLDGFNDEILPIEPIEDKWVSFGWYVQRIDGHDIEKIIEAEKNARSKKNLPSVIIADTIKGKGISYMEDVCSWHGKAPDDKEYEKAMAELKGKC